MKLAQLPLLAAAFAVAGLIALLFLHSAYEIVTGARRELGER